jgi:hypothetical protein
MCLEQSSVPAMKTRPSGNDETYPRILSKRDEEILETVHFYRYMTALDVAYRLFSPASLVHVRRLLATLCGGRDGATDQYLYRFQLPQISPGRTEKIFTLGCRGREFLATEIGLPAEWYFRPEKVRNLSYSKLLHNLVLTRLLVAAAHFCRGHPEYRLAETRICYELGKAPAYTKPHTNGQSETQTVVPDAWLKFEELADGGHAHWTPVLLEIDRGTEYQQKFKQHVRSRIEFIQSGAYRETFGIEAVTIAYATTGQSAAYRERRRQTMCTWTQEVLTELHKETWAGIFRFTSVSHETL